MAGFYRKHLYGVFSLIAVLAGLHVADGACPEACETKCKEHDRWCENNHAFKYHVHNLDFSAQNVAKAECIPDGEGDGGNPGLNLQVYRTVWDDCTKNCNTADVTTGYMVPGATRVSNVYVTTY